MNWALSDYLELLELHTQHWSFIDLGARSGFRIPHGEAIFVHASLEGSARIATAAGQVYDCRAGDVAVVLTGEAHKIRNHHGRTATAPGDLLDARSGDQPSAIKLGSGPTENRMLSGRMDVRWPLGQRPPRLPAMVILKQADAGVDLSHIAGQARGPGGSALLGSLARLLFVSAFRAEPLCRAPVQFGLADPIARAKVIIERYPFQPWKVASLAARVGMGRSNFAQRFTAEIGCTPIEALARERMKHAAALLNDSSLKIAELSERIGYRSEAAFIARFKQQFGTTPAKWRAASPAINGPDDPR